MNAAHMHRACSRKLQTGLNLIEVMVAVLILSIGLLGMGALMGVSIRNTQSANYRTEATNLAYDYIDMVRANINNAARYRLASFTTPAVCAAPEAATDFATCGVPHICDVARWQRDLCYALPNGRGRADIEPGLAGGIDMTVTICWSDDRSLDTSTSADCSNPGETQFVVTSGL